MITKEQQKDLILAKPEEIKVGGIFYLKDESGVFHTIKLDEFEIVYFKPITDRHLSEKRLYRRKNRPFESFA